MENYLLAWKVIAICICRILPFLIPATFISMGIFLLFRVQKWI